MMFKGYSGTLYKNKRTRTFSQVWDNADDFSSEFNSCGLINSTLGFSIEPQTVSTIYYLLYSRYGNSSVASSDENRFKYNLFSIMLQYAPTWERQLKLQKDLRNLTDEQLQQGAISINNNAENPSNEPSTNSSDYLQYIDHQNVGIAKRSLLDAYSYLSDVLKQDYTEDFLSRFKKLFKTFNDGLPLWYSDEEEEDDN